MLIVFSVARDPQSLNFFSGAVQIRNDPAGALVYLDGTLLGETPLLAEGIAAGHKTMRIEHRFHETLVRKVEVTQGETVAIDFTLDPAHGSVRLISNPRGSRVTLNGALLDDLTPVQLKHIQAGQHSATASYVNHRDVTRSFEVLPGRETLVMLDLVLVPWGTLTVTTEPGNANITLLEVKEAYSPGISLPVGEYAVEVSKRHHPTVVERVRVRMGANSRHIVLQRREVPLRVITSPEHAQVSVEYELGGIPRVRPYGDRMMAPMGQVTVVARAHGFRTQRRTITLGTRGATVRASLERFGFQAGHTFRDPLTSGGEGPLLVVLPPGRFQMGDSQGIGASNERPAHEVELTQPFAIGVYETTVGEYARYAQARGRDYRLPRNPAVDHPATHISIEAVQEYLRWLSKETTYQYRLPSEAEWEYAARAGVDTAYLHGNDPRHLCEYANIADQAIKKHYSTWEVAECTDGHPFTSPVGSLRPNGFKLYDMLGNVSEWVADCWSYDYHFARGDEVSYRPTDVCHQIFRGGSWDSRADTARLSYRQSSDRANDDRGVRVVREL